MLKTPVIEQVVPVTPVQRVLSESNVKGHITINIERNREREKVSERTKKQVKDRSKKDISPSKGKLKHQSKDSKNSRSRSSKSSSSHSKESKSGSKSSSSRANSHSKEPGKTASKNERSVSPGIGRRSETPARTANVETSPSIEPPPPPIISRTDEESIPEKMDEVEFNEESDEKESKKEKTGFKDLKGASKGRNYMRRNRESSASPEKEGLTGDIDLRLSGQSEKQPRLLYQEENVAENESKKLFSGIYRYLVPLPAQIKFTWKLHRFTLFCPCKSLVNYSVTGIFIFQSLQ